MAHGLCGICSARPPSLAATAGSDNSILALSRRRGRSKAKVAAARKLLVNCYVMLRDEINYPEFCRRGEVGRTRGVRRGEQGKPFSVSGGLMARPAIFERVGNEPIQFHVREPFLAQIDDCIALVSRCELESMSNYYKRRQLCFYCQSNQSSTPQTHPKRYAKYKCA